MQILGKMFFRRPLRKSVCEMHKKFEKTALGMARHCESGEGGQREKMTQKQREELIYIQGTIRGSSYTEDNPRKADCFDTLQEEIDKILEEDEKA